MSDSSFRINQAGGGGTGTYDRSRRDILLYGAGGVVECEAQNAGLTYKYEMISEPSDSSVTINNDDQQTCNFQLTKRGGYLIRLTTDAGLPSESVTILYIGVVLENSGLCLPALNETNEDNSQAPYTGERGYEEKHTAFFKWIDENASGGGVWLQPVINRTTNAPPGGESEGDRYVASSGGSWVANNVYEYSGGAWIRKTPAPVGPIAGMACWCNDEDIPIFYTSTGWKSLNELFSNVYTNAGNPQGVVTAGIGAICIDTDHAGDIYMKSSASGNTGWFLIT